PHAYRRSLGFHVGDGGTAQYFHVVGPEDEWAGAVDFYRSPFGLVNLEHRGGDRPAIVRSWTESAPVHERIVCRAIPSPPPLAENAAHGPGERFLFRDCTRGRRVG